MAQVTRNSFSPNSNRKIVEIQDGEPVVDCELNELQQIGLAELAEVAHAVESSLRSSDLGGPYVRFGYAMGTEWRPYASGTAQLFVSAGALFVDGIRNYLANDLDLTSSAIGLSFSNPNGVPLYGVVYADFVLTETGASTDPTIANAIIGQTSLREVWKPTFYLVSSTVSFEAAIASIPALTGFTPARSWNGAKARAFLFRFVQPANATTTTGITIQSLIQATPIEQASRQFFFKSFRNNTLTNSDGMVSWDAQANLLQIGAWASSNVVQGLFGRMSGSSGPDYIIGNGPTTQPAADSAPPLPGIGWTIADGQSLGWMAQGPTLSNNQLLPKGDRPFLYGLENPVSAVPALVSQPMVVASTASFQADPGSFILVTRIGADLVWHNGEVTRGTPTQVNYPAIPAPGESPSPYRAVLAAYNHHAPASNHVTGPDALERVLNWSVASPGYASPSIKGSATGALDRNLRFFLRSGNYSFSRGLKVWGNTADDVSGTAGSSIVLEGEEGSTLDPTAPTGGSRPLLSFTNPLYPNTRAANGQVAVLTLNASYIKLKNLNLTQDVLTTTGYLAAFFGDTVVLEDCTFFGPVAIKADTVIIRNCTFYTPNSVSAPTCCPAWFALGAQAACVSLTPMGNSGELGYTKAISWRLENNLFWCVGVLAANLNKGASVEVPYHANVVLYPTQSSSGRVALSGNTFFDAHGEQNIPSIHVAGVSSQVVISDNAFTGASGFVGRSGNDTAYTSLPFDGDPGGAPYGQSQQGVIIGLGYISMTAGRGPRSSTIIRDNYFSFSLCGGTTNVQGYHFWGACMAVFNSLSAGASAAYYNINYCSNQHYMVVDAGVGWASIGGNPAATPTLFGFYLARMLQDGLGVNGVVSNIRVSKNSFDVGLATTSSIDITSAWRSIVAQDTEAWPVAAGGFGYPTDTSCLIGIVLRNLSGGFPGVYGIVSAQGIIVEDNEILQRIAPGASSWAGGVLPVKAITPDFACGWYSFNPIVLSSGDFASAGANGGQMLMPRVSGNTIIGSGWYDATDSGSTLPVAGGGIIAIAAMDAAQGTFLNNTVFLSASATHSVRAAIALCTPTCSRCLIAGNDILSKNGVYGPSGNYLGNNNIKVGEGFISSGGIVAAYANAATDCNFTGE